MRKKGFLAPTVILVLLLNGCTTQLPTRTEIDLDTQVTVTLYDKRGAEGEAILDDCFDEVTRLQSLFSVTSPASDISRINAANGQVVTVSEDTASLLAEAQCIAAMSGGAFDITIRPLTCLWDFKAEIPCLPETAAVTRAVSLVDYRRLHLDGTRVTLDTGGVDAGGIAKGYIADSLCQVLAERGVFSAMIDLGGNIVAYGNKNGHDWKIGIKDPSNTENLRAVVVGQNMTVVTSGTYERGFTLNGVRYHHLLDPETGMPVHNGLASVTILASRSVVADGLSTACFVLGEERAKELIATIDNTEALFIREDGTVSVTAGLICEDENEELPSYHFETAKE